MTPHHPTPPPQDPMPLDPEERALAARLARLGPHGEPSPALDARVLAAAHAATAARPRGAAPRRHGQGWRRARWPVGAGVAASMALALAIAWQMRPLPAPVVPAAESASASTPVMSAPPQAVMGTQRAGADAASPPVASSAPAAVRERALPAPVPESDAVVAAQARDGAAAKAMVPPEEPPVAFEQAAPVDAPASAAQARAATALPPPPPPPPAPPAPPASPARAASSAAAAATAGAMVADAPEGDVPPATVASPEVRDAWLARIRELAAAGRGDEARASLAEFHRRYPEFAIPDDLRPLLPPLPSP